MTKIIDIIFKKYFDLYTITMVYIRIESKSPQKAALCHNEVNTKVSFCQKTRTEGKAKDSRTIPEPFPKNHDVSWVSPPQMEYVRQLHK